MLIGPIAIRLVQGTAVDVGQQLRCRHPERRTSYLPLPKLQHLTAADLRLAR